MNALYITLSIQ